MRVLLIEFVSENVRVTLGVLVALVDGVGVSEFDDSLELVRVNELENDGDILPVIEPLAEMSVVDVEVMEGECEPLNVVDGEIDGVRDKLLVNDGLNDQLEETEGD